ncbi:hypothetical protein BH24ACT12_BH24ACT12_24470 [soil metagenome]|jgi:hypothetical protein
MTLAQHGGHDQVVASALGLLANPELRGLDRVSLL